MVLFALMDAKQATLKLTGRTHRLLKIVSAKTGTTMQKFTEKAVIQAAARHGVKDEEERKAA